MFEIAIVIAILLHLLFMVISYGIVFAYLQRSMPKYCISKLKYHRKIALTLCIPGIFIFGGILISTQFPKFGIKFLSSEKDRSKWFYEYTVALSESKNRSNRNEGLMDLWRN